MLLWKTQRQLEGARSTNDDVIPNCGSLAGDAMSWLRNEILGTEDATLRTQKINIAFRN